MPPIGLGRFAPALDPVGPFMTSAQRLASVPPEPRTPAETTLSRADPDPPAAA